MENKESKEKRRIEIKKRWETPRIFELGFSKTQGDKVPGGGDGDPPTQGNIKYS